MGRSPREVVRRHPVSALVVLALVLRLATLTWAAQLGPYQRQYHADESKAWSSMARFPHDYLSNHDYLDRTAPRYTPGVLGIRRRPWPSSSPGSRSGRISGPMAPSPESHWRASAAIMGPKMGRVRTLSAMRSLS